MLFSIVIPTYNNAATLRKSIESAINHQYHLNYEVLVVNIASTDHTLETLNRFKGKIR
ncbi:MAG: glycosyltransferase family 2 protein, partial [Mangrovibacterium sp.]